MLQLRKFATKWPTIFLFYNIQFVYEHYKKTWRRQRSPRTLVLRLASFGWEGKGRYGSFR